MSTRQNNLIFMDTWAWLALSNRKDTHHELAKKEYEELKAAGYRIVTSDYVLDEVITALFRLVINKVFTGDGHFETVNLGFVILSK